MDSFLPEEYKVPVSPSNYMKLQEGENTFRVLTSAITGYVYWTADNKPVRSQTFPESTPNIRTDKDGKSKIKHFWAFGVWNYGEEKVQVLELTQKTIMNGIKALVDNAKWGDPKKYDITVTRTGDGLETEYAVMPNPHTEVPGKISEEFASKKINLDALYKGEDPFGNNSKEVEKAFSNI